MTCRFVWHVCQYRADASCSRTAATTFQQIAPTQLWPRSDSSALSRTSLGCAFVAALSLLLP